MIESHTVCLIVWPTTDHGDQAVENALSSSLSKAQVEMITRGAIKYSPVPSSRGGNMEWRCILRRRHVTRSWFHSSVPLAQISIQLSKRLVVHANIGEYVSAIFYVNRRSTCDMPLGVYIA